MDSTSDLNSGFGQSEDPGFSSRFFKFPSKSSFILFAKNKNVLAIFAILLLTFFFASSAILVGNVRKNTQTKAEEISFIPTPTPLPLPSAVSVSSPTLSPNPALPSPTPTVDPIASWSSYTSTQYSFSIKYPPDWTSQKASQTDLKILEYVVFNPKTATTSALSITLSYGTRTYQEALLLDPQSGEGIKVGAVSATRKTQKDSNGAVTISVIVPVGVRTILFNAQEKYKTILDQMLATLRF